MSYTDPENRPGVSEDQLGRLQTALVDALLDRIVSGKATAGDLSVARALLRDNNIQVRPEANPKMFDLVDNVPIFDE